jgi:hypothetical protein
MRDNQGKCHACPFASRANTLRERRRQEVEKRRDRYKIEDQVTGRADVIARYQVTLNFTS